MIKQVMKRFLSLLLTVMLAASLLPAMSLPVFAANVNTGVEGLTAASSGDATWTYSGGTITGSVKANKTSGCKGDSYTAQTGTLNFTNSKGEEAVLSFDYTLTLSGGSVTVDGTSVDAGANFSKKLGAGETVAVAITSNESNENATAITINNMALKEIVDVETTFVPAENGTYTVDEVSVTEETVMTRSSDQSYALSAKPASGYKFLGWYSMTKDSYLSFDQSASIMIDEPQSVTAIFVSNSTAVFGVSGAAFTDLNEAVEYAAANNKPVIVLISDGTLPAGAYTIPSGKTLLIPFDAANTLYTTAPEVVYGSHANPSAFRTLTMTSGAHITVENGGSISVPSKLCATGTGSGSWNGTPTGKHGRIAMDSGSSITLNSGAGLYVYGYISGSGSVYAGDGSTVYECFQIRCWRGGTATSGMADNSQKVFPLNQYYIQNIEAPLTLASGATERVYTAVNMSNQAFAASATFIGNGGMFAPSGTVTKKYEGASDRLILDVDGDFSITPMSLSVTGLPLIGTLDLNTSDYVLPINSNITINVDSGTTTLKQDVAFLPGSKMNIAEGAAVTLASGYKAYVYDKDQWGAYAAAGAQLVPVGYSTVNGTTAKRDNNSLTDAEIDVNGTINLNGSLYTTESGAAIISSGGTGKAVFENAPGTETNTNQATQSGSNMTYVPIPITSAKLLNGDGTYTETQDAAAGTTYYFCTGCAADGVWETEHSTDTYKLTLVADIPADSTTELDEEASVKEFNISASELETFEVPADAFACSGYTLTGWTKAAAEEETGDPIPVENISDAVRDMFAGGEAEITLTASWTPNTITIIYEGLEDAQLDNATCAYGSTIPLPGEDAVTREHYVLSGWKAGEKEYAPGAGFTAVGDFEDNTAHITASWTPKSYTVTWMNGDEEILHTVVPYGETPAYEGEDPVRAEDEQYIYTFTGWNPEPAPVVKDVVYEAVFAETTKAYTITFIDESGQVLQTSEFEYGQMPYYMNGVPAKEADDQYEYTFAGWAPELTAVAGEETYTAVFDRTLRSYKITWKNWDDSILKEENFDYGTTPEYSGDIPQRSENDQYTYTFSGWTPEIEEVSGEAEYKAVFTPEERSYTVTWKDSDGITVLWTDTVPYGTVPVYGGETPEKESTDQYEYTFERWWPEAAEVTQDTEYTAVYTETLRNYTVTWYDGDGNELDQKSVAYGETPEYEGEDPGKENPNPAKYTYTFDGWYVNGNKEDKVAFFRTVTGDTTYTASFTETINQYQITFRDEDGRDLLTQNYDYGTLPEYDTSLLVKDSTPEFTYTFDHWNPAVTEVTGDAVYTAVYSAVKNSYTVTWIVDGTETTETYEYGQMPSHADPVKESTEQYDYTFSAWQPALAPVTENAVYIADFIPSLRSYTVTWVDENGDVLDTQNVEYGAVPEYNGRPPEKAGDDQYTYTFNGWTPNISSVTGDTVYTATYTTAVNSYLIKFVDYDGTLLKEDTLEFGDMPEAPEAPNREATAKYIYSFAGWEPQVEAVTKSVTYTARYTEEIRSYTIAFMNGDEVLQEEILAYGTMPEYVGQTPVKAGDAQYSYTFIGWDPVINEVTGNQTYQAVFDQTVNTYTVTWQDEDGRPLETDPAVPYGTLPVYDSTEPSKASTDQFDYAFAGWTPDVSEVIGDVTYTAVYTETERKYTVVWVSDELDDEGRNIVLETDENVGYGEAPSYDGSEPEKASTEQYSYTFNGWVLLDAPTVPLTDDDIVTGNVTYLAAFKADLRPYTVTWAMDDGTVIETDTDVLYGSMPVFDGELPKKESTAAQTFVFKGWDPEVSEVTGDITYYAQFEPAPRQYEVKWINGDTVLATTYVDYNTNPAVPEDIPDPEKDETLTHTFAFAGWADEEGNALTEDTLVTGDTTFQAVFTEDARSGWIRWIDNEIYYVEDGNLATGVCRLPYPEDSSFGYAETEWDDSMDGGHPEDGKGTFIFNEEGKLLTEENGFYSFHTADENPAYDTEWLNGDATVWAVRGEILWHAGLVSNDGEFYYFRTGGAMVAGRDYAITKTNGLSYEDGDRTVSFVKGGKYTFDEDGVLLILDGFVDVGDVTYFYKDSIKTYAGLIQVNGDYYYVKSDCTVVKGRSYYVGKTNGLMEAGTYVFDEYGIMVVEQLSGIGRGDDGLLHYYVDGAIQKNLGLIEVDGNFYYVNGSGEVISGRDYGITKTNGLSYTFEDGVATPFKAQATYTFDGEGVLQLFHGLIARNGNTYYYEHGIKTYAGLVQIKGDYYYIKSDCTAVEGRDYYVSKTNGLMEAGTYSFDDTGKMIVVSEDPDVREGIMRDEDGILRYYVHDVVQKNLGLIKEDSSYYYVNGSGEVVNGKDYAITKTNDLVHEASGAAFVKGGKYTFDENGALCWYDGITEIEGTKYYYVNGVKTYAGLIEIGGSLYYVNSSCKLVVNSSYYVSKTNGLKEAGTYSFDADGRLTE